MLAIIKTGGKQYIVTPGQKLKVEKLAGEQGSEIVFDKVLLVEKNKKLEIGAPFVNGAEVRAKILRQAKGPKVIIMNYKNKTRQKTKKGHRQQFTEVEILEISKS